MRPALALCVALAACGPGKPDAAPCSHDPSFDRSSLVRVRLEIPPAALREDVDLPALGALSGGLVDAGKLQGLTLVEHQVSFRAAMSLAKGLSRTCAWFDSVHVDMSPASVEIFVPKEYPRGSCEYDAVLAHEREHERVNRERLEAAARAVTEALESARWLPAKGNPIEVSDPASTEAALNEKIRKVVHPVYDGFLESLRREQAFLDKPELYQWVSKRCQGWK